MVKVAIYENGCAKEEATRRYFIDKLLESGNKLVSDPNEADYIIFQSCAGVYNTVEILTEELGQTINEQKSTGNEIILVGCFNKISGYCQKIKETYPGIRIITDIDWPIPVLNYINNANEKVNFQNLLESNTMDMFFPNTYRSATTYVNISSGCNNKCTFCKGHYLDNSLHSIPYDEVLEYLTQLVNSGTKILSLHADNLTQYGIDLYGVPVLHKLIHELSKLENIRYIDLGEITIQDMYPELIYEIKTNSKVRYIGIEIQTASNPLLKLMGRNHTVEDCTHVMTQLKENPNSLIYTILMSSFPTETVQDLDDTINYVIRNNIFVEDICEYSDSIYIPSHRLGPMTEKESKDHYEYLCTFMGEYKKNWLYNNTKKVKEAMIIARGGEVTIFDISVPTVRGMSESERFLDVPVGSIIIPQSVEPTFTEKGKLICKIK